ncbi:hypothetical protein B7P43_G13100 [Cryptotermes secundus]|uniref:Uncharacterized protein n=1 Tax=Cryptotermes secundus TaxID=105785 RepID=A0A2J7REY9_9NEOP|nr:hypothetical protein B7P43_G13100 [Cryptotermes secundus]
MFLQITLKTEYLIAHVTVKWPIIAMYALVTLVSVQITLLSECLLAHVTGKWPFPAMYALVTLQMTLNTE